MLKARGYRVFATEHVVEVCLRWVHGECTALVIGPHIPWDHVATLCDWIAMNDPEKPIILLSDHRGRWPSHIVVIPSQSVQVLLEHLRGILPTAGDRASKVAGLAVRNNPAFPGQKLRLARVAH